LQTYSIVAPNPEQMERIGYSDEEEYERLHSNTQGLSYIDDSEISQHHLDDFGILGEPR